MKTTSLLAELLVIGVCGSFWVYPLISLVIPFDIQKIFLKNGVQPIFIALTLVYFLGMLINFISDRLFDPIDKKIYSAYGGKESIQKARSLIFLHSKEAADYLLQRRSIVRIFRANSLNCLILIIIVFFNISIIRSEFNINLLSLLSLLGTILLISLIAYVKTLKGYIIFIKNTGGLIHEK